MNKPATHPQYLPAVDRALEYRAGLLSVAPSQAGAPAARPTRKWLGSDFTCTTEARESAAESKMHE